MHISNILTNLLENVSTGPDLSDLVLTGVNAFSNENGVIDCGIAIKNSVNGVYYAADVMFHANSKDFRVSTIDIQDNGNTYDGDDKDLRIVEAFIRANYDTILGQLMDDLKNGAPDAPFNHS